MTRHRTLGAIAAGLLVATITACSVTALPSDGAPGDLDRVPRPVGTPAPEYAGVELPLAPDFADATLLDPGWDMPPQESDGIYLAPRVEEDRVVFAAVSDDGTVLWAAERPMLCSAFVVAAGIDGPVAVLMDIVPGDTTVSQTTVSAYDLRTGEPRWGPIDVPGPHLGPGLVFAGAPPAALGESGPRVAIDPATGAILADEANEPGIVILGEHDGVVLLMEEERLVGRSDDAAWALAPTDLEHPLVELDPPADVFSAHGLMLLGDRDAGGTLVRMADGEIVADAVHGFAIDRVSGIRVVHGETLVGLDTEGRRLWSRSVTTDATVLGAGAGSVYVRFPDRIQLFDVGTGDEGASLPATTQIPRAVSENGAAIVGSYSWPVLAAEAP